MARISKMKSMRPGGDVDVKRRAAVLGECECQYFVMSVTPSLDDDMTTVQSC